MNLEDVIERHECIYVFGYGSLTWKPDFEHDGMYLGYIKGYERRFWQGSTHHRGTVEKPGRVLTLTEVEKGVCWGAVFKIVGKEKIEKAFDCLQLREQSIGRYEVHLMPVFLKNSVQPLHAIVYYATPDNELFLGNDSLDALADDISTSCGAVGHNIEYLFRLSDFLRKYLPNERDEHVFKLDALVRSKIGFNTKDFKSRAKML
ncbi:glutathione-specific gamma-glutamylcyclotransferase 1-like [Hydractinia symbiolongicarpus]|uniref:glutathione-specific gamma-glutamylcyclotransferase 1-like n=1 Tax=Hydractinia symbiolongicarpus TaxID=13093 RepID=UPI0025511C41|nr:glutathione-specific gamma-glutamylcyclotransferase 1-like [Hydractinia symbiolongicarpus]